MVAYYSCAVLMCCAGVCCTALEIFNGATAPERVQVALLESRVEEVAAAGAAERVSRAAAQHELGAAREELSAVRVRAGELELLAAGAARERDDARGATGALQDQLEATYRRLVLLARAHEEKLGDREALLARVRALQGEVEAAEAAGARAGRAEADSLRSALAARDGALADAKAVMARQENVIVELRREGRQLAAAAAQHRVQQRDR